MNLAAVEVRPVVDAPFHTLHPNLLIGVFRALRLVAERRNGNRSGEALGYYEFGLYRGFSFWYANNLAHELGLNCEFHGFDSFEGLPPSRVDLHRNWSPGSYACSLGEVQASLAKWGMPLKFTLHKGWYSKQLFSQIAKAHALPAAAIAVIDCDLYESACEVLQFLGGRMQNDTILLFDDFNAFGGDPDHGERKALAEFEASHPGFRKEHLFSFGPYGEAFQVTRL